MGNTFFLIFILTITSTRILLLLLPIQSPTIGAIRLHHYMYGLLGIVIALLCHSLVLYSVGLGLFIDEATFLVLRGKSHRDNYSVPSLVGTALFISIVFALRHQLVLPSLG